MQHRTPQQTKLAHDKQNKWLKIECVFQYKILLTNAAKKVSLTRHFVTRTMKTCP
jgi:hypothetical protein